jgi:hypothetical protein
MVADLFKQLDAGLQSKKDLQSLKSKVKERSSPDGYGRTAKALVEEMVHTGCGNRIISTTNIISVACVFSAD